MNRRSIAAFLLVAIVLVAGLVAGCGGFPGNSPAKVGDVYIDGAEFDSQVEGYAAQYGLSLETDPDTYKMLEADVLESMIATELAVQKAPDLGITVTDEEVQEQVDALAQDYYGGDQEAFLSALESESMTMDELEAQIREFTLVGKVRDEVTKDIPAEPSEEEIAAFYEENQADFLTEEAIKARHILVSASEATVRSSATTTTESTTTTTESTDTSTEESTTTTESTTTSTLPELSWARALATAAQVRVDLLSGGSWSTLAARYSADLDTKNSGGELGTVEPGGLVSTLGQEFDNTVFALDVNQISEPVKTEHGYEVIQVTENIEPQQKSLEEASADVSELLVANAQDEAWQDFIDQAKTEIEVVYRSGYEPTTTTLEETSTTLELPEATTTTAETVSEP